MATIVQLPKDTRLEEAALGLGNYLSGVKDARLDRLQNELMREISEAPDEATAAAVMADVKYTNIMTDTERFAVVTNYLGTSQPGFNTITAYKDSGEMELISVKKGTEIDSQFLKNLGLHAERKRGFHLAPEDPEQLTDLIGNFRSRGEAVQAAADNLGISIEDVESRILNMDQARFRDTNAATKAGQRRAEASALLDQQKYDLTVNTPATVFGKLVEDFKDGDLTKVQFDAAWKMLTERIGRTKFDLKDSTLEDLVIQAAGVENASRLGKLLVDQVKEDPRVLTTVAGIARFAAGVKAEFTAVIDTLGGRPDINGLDPEGNKFNFDSLSAVSSEFKGLLFDMAIVAAAARGIKGRSFSDRDLQLFLTRVGTGIKDPAGFILNMKSLIDEMQGNFLVSYELLQDQSYNKAFTQIRLADPDSEEAKREIQKGYEGRGLVFEDTETFSTVDEDKEP